MYKKYKYFTNPDRTILFCQVYLNGQSKGVFIRYKSGQIVDAGNSMDSVTHDLELHAFMRVSLHWLTDPQSISVEDLFELDNLNI